MKSRSSPGTYVRTNTARTTSGPYGVFKTNTLVLPTVSMSPSRNATPTEGTGGESTIHQIPSLVVPAQAVASPPDGSIKFGIVFRPSMPWTWVVLQRDTTAQIFNYMPPILASAIGADDSSQVVTCKLKEYSDANVSEPRTLYLGYVPQNLSEALRSQVMDTTSQLYTATLDPVPKQLVAQIDPNFDPLMFSSRDDGTQPHTLRDALVGSFSGIGGAAVLCLLMVFFHRKHGKRLPNMKRKSNIDRRATIKSFSGLDHDADVPAVPAHVLEGGPRSGGYYIGDARNQNGQTSPPTASASMLNIDREYPAVPEDVPSSPLLEPVAGSPLTEAQQIQAEYWREREQAASKEPSPEARAATTMTNGASIPPASPSTAARSRASQAYAAGLFPSASL